MVIPKSWSIRPNPEDRINRKPDDRKNDQMTKKTKTGRPKKINSTALYLIFNPENDKNERVLPDPL